MAAKKKGKTKAKKVIEDKNRMTLLISLLISFLALFAGVIKFLFTLSEIQLTEMDYSISLVGVILLIGSYYVLEYVSIILMAIFYEVEFRLYEVKKNDKIDFNSLNLERDKSYVDVLNKWLKPFLYTFLLSISMFYVFYFKLPWGLVFGVIVSFIFLFDSLLPYLKLIKGNTFCEKLNLLFNGEFKTFKSELWSSLIHIFLILIYILSLIFITTTIEIRLDKEIYSPQDIIQIGLYPKGIIKPWIKSASVHTKEIYNFQEDNAFLMAPRYISVNASILNLKSYNSFISVRYGYFSQNIPLIGELISEKSKFIPIFGEHIFDGKMQIPSSLFNFKESNFTLSQENVSFQDRLFWMTQSINNSGE